MLVWRTIALIELTDQWQFTQLTGASLFRLSHSLSSVTTLAVRGLIAQHIEDVLVDRRFIGYRDGNEEGQLFVKPDGIDKRLLGLRRLDSVSVNWFIRVEELITLAEALPLPISDVQGLQDALDDKPSITDLAASEQLILAQLAGKAPIEHGHTVADISGLIELIESMQPIVVGDTPPENPSLGLQWLEVDINGKLINKWFWNGSSWESELILFSTEHSGSNTVWRYLPLIGKYSYKLVGWDYWIRSQRPHNSTEYVIPRIIVLDGYTESTVFEASEPPLMPAQNVSKSYSWELSQTIQTTPNESRTLGVAFVRNNNVNYSAGSTVGYKLIRK